MPVQDVIPPYEQMYLLNQQLICNADQFKHAVITVGGQAVQYWISYYHAQYGDRLPDERLTTSVDCDYSARKDDIAAIAKTLNVKTWENKDGQPPSLAQFMLIDQDTHDIKRDDGRLFAVPDAPDEPNVVDIIDRPGGFDRSDFQGKKLYLYRGARRIRKKSYAKVFRASVRAETSRLPVCGSAARRNRRLG